jgi:hypothetical protein
VNPLEGDDARWVERALTSPGVVHDPRLGRLTHPLRNAALGAGHLFVDGSSLVLARCRGQLAALLGQQPLPPTAARAMERALAAALR